YDYFRRIGAVLTDSSANIIAFKQIGDWFLWKDPPLDHSSSVSTTASLATLSVPSGIVVQARINGAMATTQLQVYISSPDQDDEAPSVTEAPLESIRSVANGVAMAQGPMDIFT